jgi:23S rRNA A2030 N6-methylase RlmJ
MEFTTEINEDKTITVNRCGWQMGIMSLENAKELVSEINIVIEQVEEMTMTQSEREYREAILKAGREYTQIDKLTVIKVGEDEYFIENSTTGFQWKVEVDENDKFDFWQVGRDGI